MKNKVLTPLPKKGIAIIMKVVYVENCISETPMKLSIVIPLFNEEAVIETTHLRLLSLTDEMTRGKIIDDYEIIYVDDGSRDGSLDILKGLSMKSPKTKVLAFSRNFGHQTALAAGILHTSGDAVVSLDADLQDPPELIPEMLREYKSGHDIVYAVRRERTGDGLFKRWTARLFYKIMKLMGVDIVYDHADYRMISRRVVEEFGRIKEYNLFLRGIFPFMGFDHALVYYERGNRHAGETKYPLKKMAAFALQGITSFSSVPLRMASFIGLVIFLGSVGLIAWAFYTRLQGEAVPGWASTVIPIFFIGGLNILFLGLIGEYVGKMYLEVKRRPLFIIKEKYNMDDQVKYRGGF
jgi:polyisoprenyl-phosphate glycosyltransferase